MFDPIAGAVFLVAAVLIAIGRVLIGAHYPGDVRGEPLRRGSSSALVVVRLGRARRRVLRPPLRATDGSSVRPALED